ARLEAQAFQEMLKPACMLDTLRAQLKYHFDLPNRLEGIPDIDAYYGRPRAPGKPLILIASPYCVYPPAHGGARRIHQLIERLSGEFDIILLSDESEHYSNASFKYFQKCHLVSLVRGRNARPDYGRINRILSHSNLTLAARL